MIDKNNKLKVPKRLYIMDYQLEPCEIDGISDARLNLFPFNTTDGKLVEYLCLDTLWHPASENPKVKQVGDSVTCFVKFKDGSIEACVYSDSWGWRSDFSNHEYIKNKSTEWLYIDDLLPKKGGKQ